MKIKVYTVDVQLPRWLKRPLALSAITAVAAIAVVAAVRAAPASVPNTFVDGEALSAAKMNANFTALTSQLDATNGTLATVQERMVAKDANGNVGIGTVNPGSRLDVRSAIWVASPDFVLGSAGSVLTMGLGAASGNTYASFDSHTGGGTAFGNVVFHPTGNGHVGIGTTSPANSLHVKGPDGNVLAQFETSAGGANAWVQMTVPGRSFLVGTRGDENGNFAIFDNTALADRLSISVDGKVGVANTAPQYALDVAGTIRGDNLTPSDRSLKKNITPLPADTLTRVRKLDAVTFEWDQRKTSGLSKQPQIGLIAQDVEKVFPSLVETDGKGIKSIHYMGVTAVLLEAVKAQQKRIEALESRMRLLENRLSASASAITKPATGRRRPPGSCYSR